MNRKTSFTLVEAVLGWLAGLFLGSVGASVAVALGAAPDATATRAAAAVGLWGGWMAATALFLRRREVGPGEGLGLRVRLVDVPIGLAAGVLTQLVVAPLIYLPLRPWIRPEELERPARDLFNGSSGVDLVALVVMTVVLAPLFEEILFRGVVLSAARRLLGTFGGVVAAGIAFGAIHFQLATLPGLAAIGIVLCALVARFDRLGPAIVAHVAFNATAVVTLLADR